MTSIDHKHVLVTGANGFVGSAVVNQLLQRPDVDHVTLVLRRSSDIQLIKKYVEFNRVLSGRVDTIYADVRDAKSIQQSYQQVNDRLPVTAVINLSGLLMGTREDMFAVNDKGVMNLVGAIQLTYPDHPVVFVQAGSLTELGLAKVGDNEQPVSDYALSKLSATRYLKNLKLEAQPVLPVIFRPAVVIGAGDSAMRDLFNLVHTGHAFLISGGMNFALPYVPVQTVAEALVKAAVADPSYLEFRTHQDKIYYLESGHHTWEEIMRLTALAVHGDAQAAKPIYVPQILAQGLAVVEQFKAKVLPKSKPRITLDKLKDAAIPYQCDGSRAREDFALKDITVADALRDQHLSYEQRGLYDAALPGVAELGLSGLSRMTSGLALLGMR